MTLLWTFLNAWGVGLSGAIMPGPLLMVDIRESYRRGFWTGPLMVLGHAILETALVIGLFWGLGKLIAHPVAKGVLGVLGGLLLLWMAWGMLKSGGKEGLELQADEQAQKKTMHPIVAGIVVSLTNPYWSIWWAGIGLAMMVGAQKFGAIGVFVFLAGHLMADLVWYTLISAAVAGGRHIIPPVFFRGLVIVCGLFLVYLSVGQFIPDGLRAFGVW